MRVIARSSLVQFWSEHPDAELALKAWHAEVAASNWSSSAAVKARYRSASIVTSERVVFNSCGNKYRLVAAINYRVGIVFIKFIGTHYEYDGIDARTVEWKPK